MLVHGPKRAGLALALFLSAFRAALLRTLAEADAGRPARAAVVGDILQPLKGASRSLPSLDEGCYRGTSALVFPDVDTKIEWTEVQGTKVKRCWAMQSMPTDGPGLSRCRRRTLSR
eukprot:scaffold994_cov226-Prasinococcus_capsulatus_cf.AAC.15